MISHIDVATSLLFDSIGPSWLSHQELLFYTFILIATGLSHNIVNFHMSSFILYG